MAKKPRVFYHCDSHTITRYSC